MEYKHGKKRGESGHTESISVACSCCFCPNFTLAFEFNAVHKITDRYPGIRTEDDIIAGISSAVVFTSCMLRKKGEAWEKYLICGGTVHCLKVTWNHLSWWAVTCKLLTCFILSMAGSQTSLRMLIQNAPRRTELGALKEILHHALLPVSCLPSEILAVAHP